MSQFRILVLGLAIVVGLSDRALAQIVPDQTLPVGERSQISGDPSIQIDGGATRGSNLFHSFQQFSIPTGGSASFNNAPNITNIITRVTGNNFSNIDGLIRANGTANLFLINPNGILFGANAQLQIGGSFLASTANSLKFADKFEFSATASQTPPLLTISTPIGLQYGNRPGEVRVQGATLQVPNGQTLALMGGNVSIDQGQLLAPGGRVALGGISEAGTVGLNQDGSLSFPDRIARADVVLTNGAFVDVTAGGGGEIAIAARNLNLSGGSHLRAGIGAGLGTAQAQAGDITIQAAEDITLQDESFIDNSIASDGIGKGGDIWIAARSLFLTNGSQVQSGTFSEGAGGNLTVNATDSIQLIGESADGQFGSGLFTQTESSGNAGNLSIATGNLIVRDGALVSSGAFSKGAGGNLTVNATDSIQLIGESADGQFGSGLFTQTESSGNAGNLSIATGNLIVRDGARVSSGTFSEGAGGNLTVNATDSIQLIGASKDGRLPSLLTARTRDSGNAGDITLKTRQLLIEDRGQVSSQQITATATGSVGNIRVEAASLSVGNNASITVEDSRTTVAPQSTDTVGNIDLQTNTLKVDRGTISAATASTDGGNISLDVQTVLLLRNGGLISTNAGTAQAGGNGGNITLNGNFIVAVPQENSNISANAFTGRGGNIRITTEELFGIQPRASATTGLSSITASSQFGISGTIVLNTPDVDPNRGLVQLPTELQDTSGLIASTCPADQGNSFALTGRGGLPDDPRQPLMSDRVWLDDRAQTSTLPPQASAGIVEAQGWVRDRNGTVTLVATRPSAVTQPSQSILCALLTGNQFHDR